MGNAAPKLLAFLGLVVIVLILVLVSRNSASTPGTSAQNVRDAIKQSTESLKGFSYAQYARYMTEDLQATYEAHGDVPVVAGPTGRPNPFSPF